MSGGLYRLYELARTNEIGLRIDIFPYHIYHPCIRLEVEDLGEPVYELRKHAMKVLDATEFEYALTHNLLEHLIEDLIKQVKGKVVGLDE